MSDAETGHKTFFFAFVASTLIAVSAAGDTLLPGSPLADGKFLVSSDGTFKLGFFSAGQSSSRYVGIWYSGVPDQTVVWVANRDDPLRDMTGVLSLSDNGNLSISDSKGSLYWSTPSTRLPGHVAKLLDSGNFVVSRAGGYAWQSFDHPTDTILPGMKVGINRRTGLSKNLTSWKSLDDPGTGDYTFFPDAHGDPQTFLIKGLERVWRSGPWVGETFSGIPQMMTYDVFNLSYVSDNDEAYYVYTMLDKTLLSRLVLRPEGSMERLLWMEKEQKWNVYWSAPRDKCDYYGYCGRFGVCDASQSLLCSCLQGFAPSSPANWNLRDGKEGCRRRTPLDCQNGTDGFVKIANAKIPDTSSAVVNWMMGIDECRESCLRNCSCTGYASSKNNHGLWSGCIMWSDELMDIRLYDNGGQDLFVRLARADLDPLPRKTKRRFLVAAASASAGALAVILLLWFVVKFVRWRRKSKSTATIPSFQSMKSQKSMEEMTGSRELDLPLFELAAIAAATRDFSAENRLGEGGFGPVYKGILEGNQMVAVKRLAKSSSQGLSEFMNEVRVIAKLQHRNLVRLLGCCIDGEERILVYEYLPYGSLDSLLFNNTKAPLLDWPTRLRIIGGIARGLLYLHQDSRLRIVHRDLKASNVLLDNGMNPKISDFGMARVFSGEETEGVTRRVVGTYGYMSPEYAMDGSFSVKSDVFSFGVLVLEIISGRKNRAVFDTGNRLNLLADVTIEIERNKLISESIPGRWREENERERRVHLKIPEFLMVGGCFLQAWNLSKEGRGLELADASLGYPIPTTEVLKCIRIGLLCVQERPEDRPEMAAVVVLLGGEYAALPQPKPPGFVIVRERTEGSSNSTSSVNDITLSTIGGR